MNETSTVSRHDSPFDEQEIRLAEFLDRALEDGDRVRTVSASEFFQSQPDLVPVAEMLAQDLDRLLAEAHALREESLLLRSDIMAASEEDEAPNTGYRRGVAGPV